MQAPSEETLNSALSLTESEKDNVRQALEVLEFGGVNDAYGEATCNAKQTILAYGERDLPFLKEELVTKDFSEEGTPNIYLFSGFVSALAGPESLDLILETLSLDSTRDIADDLLATIEIIVSEVRQRDPQDEFLSEAIQKVAASCLYEYNISRIIAASGIKEARDILGAAGEDDVCLRNLLAGNFEEFGIRRYRFDTWDEVLAARRRSESEPPRFDTGAEKEIDESPTIQRGRSVLGMVDTNLSEVFGENLGISKTFLPAIYLHMFNYVDRRGCTEVSEEEFIREMRRFGSLVRNDVLAANDEQLPSIGIEVEVPNKLFPFWYDSAYGDLAMVLETFGLDVKEELTTNTPTEIALPPSNSAAVQNRILLELRRLGVVPLDRRFASLHISLGIPENAIVDPEVEWLVSDILTYAFVPASRVRNRGYSSGDVIPNKDKDVEEFFSVKDTAKAREKVSRLEFRTPRVVGPNTYRLLHEVQLVGSLLIDSSSSAQLLAQEMLVEGDKLLASYGLEPSDPGRRKEVAAEAIEKAAMAQEKGEPNLISASRHFITKYSLAAAKLRDERELGG